MSCKSVSREQIEKSLCERIDGRASRDHRARGLVPQKALSSRSGWSARPCGSVGASGFLGTLSRDHRSSLQALDMSGIEALEARHSLFYAVEQGMLELVADLIKEGADINERDKVSLYRVLSVAFSV